MANTLWLLRENPNLGIAGALRDARLTMPADAGKGLPAEIAHPFFSAAFVVNGEMADAVPSAPSVAYRRIGSQVYNLRRKAVRDTNGDHQDPRQV